MNICRRKPINTVSRHISRYFHNLYRALNELIHIIDIYSLVQQDGQHQVFFLSNHGLFHVMH